MKKNGFTLTELIAVITIIGVVLLITIPITKNIMANNEEEKLTFYVQTVEKALYTYADMELGYDTENVKVTIEDLINAKYLKAYNENGVTNGLYTFKITKDKDGIITIQQGTLSEIKICFKKKSIQYRCCTKTMCPQ